MPGYYAGGQPGSDDGAAVTADVVVVGSANVDLVMRVERLPRPGETVIGGTLSRAPGGKGANQAAAAARLGARTWLVGMIGDDELGAWTRAHLEEHGVDLSFLGVGSSATGVAQIWLDDAGENAIAVASGANAEVSADLVRAAIERIDAREAVVLASLEIPEPAVEAAAEAARARGWPVVLNPAPARPLSPALLACCAVLTPNEHEMTELAPDEHALLGAGVGAVVVTRGEGGADLHRAGREVHRQPAFPVEVLDTTGAGDAFSAALAWALADGRELEDAVRLAVGAGALAVRAVGARASLPDRDELERLVAG